jgi:hypothetical protein
MLEDFDADFSDELEAEALDPALSLEVPDLATSASGEAVSLPGEPIDAVPGSPDKVRILTERASRGEPLFHPGDTPGIQPTVALHDSRSSRPRESA